MLRELGLIALAVALSAILLAAIWFAESAGAATYEDPAAAIHVLCRGQERYVDCKERWADAYRHGLAAPDPAAVVKWWNQGTQCRLQGFDLYDEETGHCIAFGESVFEEDPNED